MRGRTRRDIAFKTASPPRPLIEGVIEEIGVTSLFDELAMVASEYAIEPPYGTRREWRLVAQIARSAAAKTRRSGL